MKTIETAISEMLKENTGVSMLDSGGDNGRAWQRNQVTDFLRNRAEFTAEVFSAPNEEDADENGLVAISPKGVSYTADLFQYLAKRLEVTAISESENALLQAKLAAELPEFSWVGDPSPLSLMEDFVKERNDGESDYCIFLDAINTYNGTCLLSQTIQFCSYQLNNVTFLVLQIHNGADVRGGYTDPQVFECKELDCFVLDYDKCSAQTEDGEQVWDAEAAGYYWSNVAGDEDLEDVLAYNPTTATFHHLHTNQLINFYAQ